MRFCNCCGQPFNFIDFEHEVICCEFHGAQAVTERFFVCEYCDGIDVEEVFERLSDAIT